MSAFGTPFHIAQSGFEFPGRRIAQMFAGSASRARPACFGGRLDPRLRDCLETTRDRPQNAAPPPDDEMEENPIPKVVDTTPAHPASLTSEGSSPQTLE